MKRSFPAALLVFAGLAAAADVSVSGGLTLNGKDYPLLFTWESALPVSGTGWASGENIRIVLRGPLTWPGVEPADLTLGTATADASGNFAATPAIPYDGGVTGPSVRIPRPGFYEVRAVGAVSGTALAADYINLAPRTYTGDQPPYDWGRERGGRDGVLPGDYRQYSPERFDPEWVTVWNERPVEVYGSIAADGAETAEQVAQISPVDLPATHYGHDANFFLVPDPTYLWVAGTANYYEGEEDSPERGRIEIEWETQNGGGTGSYGQGAFGLPLWANPTVGDRVYVVGRWILDAGHPELGDRTEIHPPRLLATMRQRPAVTGSGATAAQVDIYASGHGGGANRMPFGLSAQLVQGGWGGGRIRDALNESDQDKYYRAGPISPLLAPLVSALVRQVTGLPLTGSLFGDAGPSAFSWGKAALEEQPLNDMNYEFDFPLPPPPDGAASVMVETVTQPQHTTAVIEDVTFTNEVNGLPTTAHIRLPYLGADNGIYARTLRFSWNVPAAPANRFRVRINRITAKDTAGVWQLWADVSGRWSYLGPLKTANGQATSLPESTYDVYLAPTDTLRVLVQGYRAACLDDFFGSLFDMSAYLAGLTFLQKCGATDNDNLGGAVLELPADASSKGTYQASNRHFQIEVSVE